MSVHTQPNNQLTLKLDTGSGTFDDVSCQVINLEFSMPGIGAGATIRTACPDGVVVEPGEDSEGALTGEIFVDSSDAGISRLLAQAYATSKVLKYDLTYWTDDPDHAMRFTGEAQANSFKLPFSKPGLARQPLDLAVKTAALVDVAA